RRTARIVLPTICCGSPRTTRAQRNSAERMRRPAKRGASPRTIVSTSGSSGMLRNIDQDIVPHHLDPEGRDDNLRIVIVRARAAIEFPGVPGAGQLAAVDGALSQRPAAMRAGSGQRVDGALHIANRIAV